MIYKIKGKLLLSLSKLLPGHKIKVTKGLHKFDLIFAKDGHSYILEFLISEKKNNGFYLFNVKQNKRENYYSYIEEDGVEYYIAQQIRKDFIFDESPLY